MKASLRSVIIAIATLAAEALCSSPTLAQTVATRQGIVVGQRDTGEFGDYERFLGIPFAQPPVGALRLAPPAAPKPFPLGVLFARKQAKPCMQPKAFSSPTGSEDCLYLNVWRPTPIAADEKLPVMVFIHGGGYTEGSSEGPTAEGENLATFGRVVQVGIQYRLGTLGYLSHPGVSQATNYAGLGNYGTLDQIQALKWVQSNIAAFGGDPQNVTISGESAGGHSVATLFASPLAQPLFKRGILESAPRGIRTRAEAEAVGHAVATKLCGAGVEKVPALLLACLRALPAQRLIEVQAPMVEVDPIAIIDMTHRPVIDGYVLREDPFTAIRRVSGKQMIVGSNLREADVFIPLAIRYEDVRAGVKSLFGDDYDRILALYGADSEEVAVDRVVTDIAYTCQAKRLAAAAVARNAGVYQFQFAHYAKTLLGVSLPPYHVSELFPVFGRYDSLLNLPDNRRVQMLMMTAWTNFARTGDPNTGLRPLEIVWQPVSATARPFLSIAADSAQGVGSTIRQDVAAETCRVLDQIPAR